jgi:thiamine pyrophosphokinase
VDGSSTHAIVIANGGLPYLEVTRQRVFDWLDDKPEALIVAVNGGTHNALSLGLTPAAVVGDLDSLHRVLRQRLAAAGCHFETHPARKDETDLELALGYAVRRGVEQMWVLGALGGRLDQALANILLLTLPMLEGVEVRIIEGHQTAWLMRAESEIRGQPGDTLSLIPLDGDAHGVKTEGLEYPLDGDALPFGLGLGISNVLTGERARVSVRQGTLLAVHTAGGAV